MQALLQHPMQHGACAEAVQSREMNCTCRGGAAACDLCEAASALLSASARGCRAAGVLCCGVPFVSAAAVPARSEEEIPSTSDLLQCLTWKASRQDCPCLHREHSDKRQGQLPMQYQSSRKAWL